MNNVLTIDYLLSLQKTKTQKTSDWHQERLNKIGASEITNLVENKYQTYKQGVCKKIANEFTDNIYVKYGNLFEESVFKYLQHLVENDKIPLIKPEEKDSIIYSLGCFVFENSVFSPDALYINEHSCETLNIINSPHSKIKVIHIFEFKAPAKRSVKNLLKEYYHQLNYASYVLYNILEQNGFIYGQDYIFKLHFLAVKFLISDSAGIKFNPIKNY